MIAVCETDFAWLQTQFAGVDITKAMSLPMPTMLPPSAATQAGGSWFAGLFTINLPRTVTTGEEFDIVVRRIGKRSLRIAPPPPPPPPPPPAPKVTLPRRHGGTIHIDLPQPSAPAGTVPVKTVVEDSLTYERYIVGSFQVKILVSTRKAMLPAEESTLAILRARLEVMPKTDRWYPVLLRYIGQIAGAWTASAAMRTPSRHRCLAISQRPGPSVGPARRTWRSSPAKSARSCSIASATSSASSWTNAASAGPTKAASGTSAIWFSAR